MTTVVEDYISRATALICIVDGTQGAITNSLQKTLKKVCYDFSQEGNRRTGLHREAILFVCNKWDQVPSKQQPEVLESIKNGARRYWSPEVKDSQFITMDTLSAFKA